MHKCLARLEGDDRLAGNNWADFDSGNKRLGKEKTSNSSSIMPFIPEYSSLETDVLDGCALSSLDRCSLWCLGKGSLFHQSFGRPRCPLETLTKSLPVRSILLRTP